MKYFAYSCIYYPILTCNTIHNLGTFGNFIIQDNSTTQSLPYDFESVMHFPYNLFSYKESAPTIVPKSQDIPLISLGKSNTGTDLDFLHVNLLYCGGTCVQLHNERKPLF